MPAATVAYNLKRTPGYKPRTTLATFEPGEGRITAETAARRHGLKLKTLLDAIDAEVVRGQRAELAGGRAARTVDEIEIAEDLANLPLCVYCGKKPALAPSGACSGAHARALETQEPAALETAGGSPKACAGSRAQTSPRASLPCTPTPSNATNGACGSLKVGLGTALRPSTRFNDGRGAAGASSGQEGRCCWHDRTPVRIHRAAGRDCACSQGVHREARDTDAGHQNRAQSRPGVRSSVRSQGGGNPRSRWGENRAVEAHARDS